MSTCTCYVRAPRTQYGCAKYERGGIAVFGTMLPRRCCKCNRTAKCVRYACVRNGEACTGCLPGDLERCRNVLPRGSGGGGPALSITTATTAATSLGSTTSAPRVAIPCSASVAAPAAFISSPPASPSWVCPPSPSEILSSHITTLSHVPKGVRDSWARAFSDCLTSICSVSDDVSRWSKLFMFAKCVLVSPAVGHRLPWREILQLVKARLRRCLGDWDRLWSEAFAESRPQYHCKRPSSSTAYSPSQAQRHHNIRRARSAAQDGQYSKAIQALTSEGLASAEVLQEMLSKHPQAPFCPPAWPCTHPPDAP